LQSVVLDGMEVTAMSTAHKILIVDDDPLFVKTTKTILEAHGYQVDSAGGGAAGLAKMKEQKPDLVILDVMMDWVLDGVSLSRDMMKQPDLAGIAILMATSIRNSEYKGTFPQDEYLHIDRWLDKPCSPEELLTAVEKTLERRAQSKNA
jgi:DNA-binding response OmpR family regulator